MVKLVFLCRRREGLTRPAYAERLLSGHVPLALRHHPTMRRYVVNVVDEPDPSAPTPDSIGELWFDTLDDYRNRLYDSPEGERRIGADVRGFLGAADAYVTEETVHRPPPPGPLGERTAGVKIVVGIRRSSALEPPSFAAHWRERHVPLVLACPEVRGYATSIVSETLSPAAEPLDGFAELWFASEADLARHVARARDPRDPIAEDVGRFVGGATLHRVAEYVER
jgi:uncharacterized protein (TIGR02118 family)